jgi:molybdenum cofactor cytidylyltransferase
MKAGVIILAGGASTRMGESKQMLQWQDKTLLQHAVDTAFQSGAHTVVVVLGSNEEEHRDSIKDTKALIVSNPLWRTGMGSSLKEGIKQISDHGLDSVIVMVCDQPFVTAKHLEKLWKEYDKSKVKGVVSSYSGTFGVPALLGPDLFDDVLALADDQGAKKIFQQLPAAEFKSIALKDGETDLDTYDDYLRNKP